MKKLLALTATFALMATMLAACGGSNNTADAGETAQTNTETAETAAGSEDDSDAEAAPASGGGDSIVRVGIGSDPADLSPFTAMSDGGNAFKRTVYEYLIDRETFGGEMKGVIMKDYEQVDDTTYRMEIYDYIYDTEGNHLTANDVKWSIEAAQSAGNLPKLSTIESVEVLGDYEVEFSFTTLEIGDLEALWSESPIVTQAAFEASADGMSTTPVGTSAYKVTEYVSGSKLVCERTGSYWQTEDALRSANGRDNVDTIEFQIITEASQMSIALETGTIDVSTGVSDNDISRFQQGGESADGFNVYQLLNNRAYMLIYNCDASNPFANEDLRKAVAYALDSNGLAQGAFAGKGEMVYTYGNAKYSDYIPAWENEEYYAYDLEKAQEHLDASGFDTNQTIRIMVESGAEREALAQVAQGFLAQIGISAEILVYDNALFTTYQFDPNEFDLIINTKGSTDYIVNVWKLDFDARQFNGMTANFIVDDELQSLLNTARSFDGHTEENVNAFHQYITENCYSIGLTNFYSNIVHADFITEVFTDARGYVIPGACSYS